jgi:hypothetical protein
VFYGRVAWAHGVVFVPPHDRYLAACNLELGTITFFRITSLSPLEIQNQPELEWKHESIYHPDGLAFSNCGKWLAVANHGKQTVTSSSAATDTSQAKRLASILSRLQSSKTPGSVIRTRSPSRQQLI